MASSIKFIKSFKPVIFSKKDLEDLEKLISSYFDLHGNIDYKIRIDDRLIEAKGIEKLFNESLPKKITDLEISAHERSSNGHGIIGSIYIDMSFFTNKIRFVHEDEFKARGFFPILLNFFEERRHPYFLMNRIIHYSIFSAPIFVLIPMVFSELFSIYWSIVFSVIALVLSITGLFNYKKKIFDISKIFFVDDIERKSTFKDPTWLTLYFTIFGVIGSLLMSYFL